MPKEEKKVYHLTCTKKFLHLLKSPALPPPPITFLMANPLTTIWVKMSSLYVINLPCGIYIIQEYDQLSYDNG